MSRSALKRIPVAVGVLLALVAVAAGCGGSDDGGGGGAKIALLLPENETPRYEAHDRPEFEENVESMCEGCDILYPSDAGWRQVRERLAWLYWNGKGCAGAI